MAMSTSRPNSSRAAIVIVSHNLQHVFHVADRIVVMRGGRNAGERIRQDTTQEEIVQIIVGAKSDYAEEEER